MITNLFSIFDPSINKFLTIRWVSITLFIIIITPTLWVNSSKATIIIKKIKWTLVNEFETILGTKNKYFIIILVSIFTFILFNNLIGLFPYIFNSTSHIRVTLRVALPLWLGLNLFGWINQISSIFAHLVPQSTPDALIPFIVLIETTRNVIRPITLAIRLSANIIAGHLLMTLLGNQFSIDMLSSIIPVIVVQIMLTILETAVSIIQAYVFTILSTLYINEIPSN